MFAIGTSALEALCGVYVVVGSLSMVSNSFVIAAIVRAPALRAQRFFLIVAALAVSGCISGEAFLAAGILRWNQLLNSSIPLNIFTQTQCAALNFTFIFGGIYHELLTLLIALERLYAVALPMSYRIHGGRHTIGAVVGISVFSLAVMLMALLGTNSEAIMPVCNLATGTNPIYFNATMIGLRMVPCWGTAVVYLASFLVSKLKEKSLVGPNVSAKDEVAASQHRRQQKISQLAQLIVLTYSLTTGIGLPTSTIAPILPVDGLTKAFFVQLGGCLVVFNTFVNVFVYPLRCQDMRTSMKAMLGFRKAAAAQPSANSIALDKG